MVNLCSPDQCFGCGACSQICSKKCITMQYNEGGFLAPCIDKSNCVDCGLCKKVCPVLNPQYKLQNPKKVFCATLRERESLKKSSSGGLGYALAKSVIAQGGIAFGAVYDTQLKVEHQILKTETDLAKAQGSKYVQSDINICYKEAKKYLQEGKAVLFTGTPCQIAGLYGYLQNTPQDKLLTCDLLCSGVPSPKLFKNYISYLEEKYKNKITKLNFRNKRYGYSYGYLHSIITQNNKDILLVGVDSSFVRTLGLGYVRESCFKCPFRSIQRVADFTVGDFWDLPIEEDRFEQGLSLGLINTDKAADFLKENILPQIHFTEQTLKDLQKSQGVSIRPIKKKPADYEEFFAKVWQMSWPEITKKYIYPKSSFKHNLMDSLPPAITSVIRKTIRRISIWRKQKAK